MPQDGWLRIVIRLARIGYSGSKQLGLSMINSSTWELLTISRPCFAKETQMSDPQNPHSSEVGRRELLKGALGAGLYGGWRSITSQAVADKGRAPQGAAAKQQVRDENLRPGTTDWQLTYTRVDPATKYRCPWIEGYVSGAACGRATRWS